MTGEPIEYSPAQEEDLYDAMGDIPDDATGFDVTGVIEWSGEVNSRKPRRQLRASTHVGPNEVLNLAAVKAAKAAADQAAAAAKNPPWGKSFNAKGWHAQLSRLTANQHGSAAADAAGLDPSPRTLRGWLAEEKVPSPANQAAIGRAYEQLATRITGPAAETEAKRAYHVLAEALNGALKDHFGVPIRITHPDHFDWV